MTKKILYVATLFRKKNCSASIRNVALVNALCRLDCKVTVLTIKFPDEVLDDFLVDSLDGNVNLIEIDAGVISYYIPNDINVHEQQLFSLGLIRHFIKFIKQLHFFPHIDKGVLRNLPTINIQSYDLLVSSSDTKTAHFIGLHYSELMYAPWLQIWGDPWEFDVGLSSKIIKQRVKKHEHRLLKRATHIAYVSVATLTQMQRKYTALKSNMTYLSRSYFSEIHSVDSVDLNCFTIVYTGSLEGRNISPFLKALSLFNLNCKLQIELLIYGKLTSEQFQLVSQNPYAQYKGTLSFKETLAVYKTADALLYIGNPARSTQIPGKLFDYFGTEKLILALLESENDDVAKFIKESERCVCYRNKVSEINLYTVLKLAHLKHDIMKSYSPITVAQKLLSTVFS